MLGNKSVGMVRDAIKSMDFRFLELETIPNITYSNCSLNVSFIVFFLPL
jgi:hypothetical protein